MKIFPAVILGLAAVSFARRANADATASANYTQVASAVNAGGQRSGSAAYTNDATVGEIGSGAVTFNNLTVTKSGFVGQLYDPTSLMIGTSAASVNEGQTLALSATEIFDDGTNLPLNASAVTWSAVSGPIQSINSAGLLTAQIVYADTPATARGTCLGVSGDGNFTVVNVNNDDFGLYANDGIPDFWQVAYFGVGSGNGNPAGEATANPSGDGHNNLYDYVAGVNPTVSFKTVTDFAVNIIRVPGQPFQRQIVFGPILAGRSYTVLSTTTLPGTWTTITGASQSDNGTQRTVTDPNAASAPVKFYRVQITIP